MPQQTIKLTEPHSKERIEELMKATTHGAKFLATGGAHLMTDDLFIAAQRNEKEKEIAEMEKVKKRKLGAMKIHDATNAIFEKKATRIEDFTSALSLLWSWILYSAGTIYQWGR